MRINFKKTINTKGVLFISIDSTNKDEVVKENDVKTFHLKPDEKINLRKFFLLIRKIVKIAKNNKMEKISLNFENLKFEKIKCEDYKLAEIIGVQLELANYSFIKYKSKKDETFIKEIFISNIDKKLEKFILKGQEIGKEINKSRELSNTPGGDMTPSILANEAKKSVSGLKVKVTVLGEREMKKLNMEAILSVGRGSKEESKFVIMEYYGSSKKEKPIVLVGKGVTFDTGGINLKPASGLSGMNMDMSGGSIAIHTISLVAKMKLKINVVVLIPSVENSVSGESYRPGDIISSMSGKTIEVLNTDAEGRVILADALHYAQRYNPKIIIDIATLTGAALVALGERASAIFGDSNLIIENLIKTGEETGDYLWRLPLWEEYESEIKGSVGDYTNIGNKNNGYGGAIHGAIFLKQFVNNYPWVHIDIAPRMTSIEGDYLAKGSTSSPLYLLYKYIENNI